jgi:drug/metabolite transporter (DMT)-like permease
MGRFEKRPDNPRVRGELSRAAETALWAVVEDLEHLQQNMLRTFQEEIKRLQAEKNRLSGEIQQLRDEKEHLQQVKHITEQQVLIRQLSEALAKHISSQLQSSLATLARQAEGERAAGSLNPTGENNKNAEQLLGTLDDTLTITFNSLQQELKNYQSNLSQQLSRMYSQQQQGETILEDLINHLRGELATKNKEASTVKVSPPTVLQPPELQFQGSLETVKVSPPTVLQPPELQSQSSLQTYPQQREENRSDPGPTSFITKSLSQSNTAPPQALTLSSETMLPRDEGKATEPISVISRGLSESNITSPPAKEKATEPNSLIPRDLSESDITSPSAKENATEPSFVIPKNWSEIETKSPPAAPSPKKQGSTPPPSAQSRSFPLSPIQIGFLLIVLSAVVSSLYNVAIKQMFYKSTETFTSLEVQGLISPTLGNIFLILTLRLMVVVPLMILLAPIMYPQVWQDLQNLRESVSGNSTSSNVKAKRVLQLSVASGCFLFLSQVLIYQTIGQVSAGMAIALFFVYPLISGLLSWLLFRERPSLFGAVAIGSIFCGELLVLGGFTNSIDNIYLGGTTGIFAGLAFACYVILTRICATKIHPVSFTLINFVTMLVLSFIFLMLPLPESWSLTVDPSKLVEIVLSAFILGVLTLLGYVFNNVGIRKLGASKSAIIGAGVPILTVIFAGLIIQETLEIAQILGVLLVSFGAAAFSFDKMQNQERNSSPEN